MAFLGGTDSQPADVPVQAGRILQSDKLPGSLLTSEKWWRDQYYWLQEHGYQLRSRFHPDWTPPWVATGADYTDYEEGQWYQVSSSAAYSYSKQHSYATDSLRC